MIRRRSPRSAVEDEQMAKNVVKNNNSRVCVLATLSALLWFMSIYFHFVASVGNKLTTSLINLRTSNADVKLSGYPIDTLPTLSIDPGNAQLMSTNLSNNVVPTRNNDSSNPEWTSNDHPNDDLPIPNSPLSMAESQTTSTQLKPENFDDLPIPNSPPSKAESQTTSTQLKPEKFDNLPIPNSPPSKASESQATSTQLEPEKFPFVRAVRTVDNKSDPCGGRYVYVHDLPPRFNEDMLKECRSLSRWTNMCKFTTNAGLGPPLENVEGVFSDEGWYATNQFAVDVIFSNRMKQYECLTNDSSLASALFVPFYAGFDIARYLWGYNTSTRDAASLELVDWLMKRPEWRFMGGKDHFLVAGRITWDFRRLSDSDSDWGSKLLFLPAAKNMSMLVVESSPWNANDFGIPYPTYFHPAKDADVFQWQDRMRNLERKWLFSFAGAPRPGNPKSIRGDIINQCKQSDRGKLLECDFGESKCHSPGSIMKMFQSSVFCLQPQGDSFTRRSAFDSMLAGCIPVFFHPGSAYTQYTWHLPKHYSKYSVFIPENDIRKGNVSIEQRLNQISPKEVEIMREEVISLIPQLIYVDPRSKLETLKDAFDVSVQAIINKVTGLRRDIVEGRTDDDFIEEVSWRYDLVGREKYMQPHEWDPFFSKPKGGNQESS